LTSKLKDTHSKSMSEAFVNSFGSYPIGYGLGIMILPLSVGWIQEDPFTANIVITAIYATVSFGRSYFYRRVFERFGIDDNFIRLGIKGIFKAKNYFIMEIFNKKRTSLRGSGVI
jgi:hypothetical protein